MNKIRLDPEALAVETFVADRTDAGRAGTVRAHETAKPCNYPGETAYGPTCDVLSCGGTCQLTGPCYGNCGNTRVDPTCEGEPECG